MAQVLGSVEQQHRALAEHRPEQRVGLAGVQLLTRFLEELLDQRRVITKGLSNSVLNVTAPP